MNKQAEIKQLLDKISQAKSERQDEETWDCVKLKLDSTHPIWLLKSDAISGHEFCKRYLNPEQDPEHTLETCKTIMAGMEIYDQYLKMNTSGPAKLAKGIIGLNLKQSIAQREGGYLANIKHWLKLEWTPRQATCLIHGIEPDNYYRFTLGPKSKRQFTETEQLLELVSKGAPNTKHHPTIFIAHALKHEIEIPWLEEAQASGWINKPSKDLSTENTQHLRESSKPYQLIAQLIKTLLPDADLSKANQTHAALERKLQGDEQLAVSKDTLKKYLEKL